MPFKERKRMSKQRDEYATTTNNRVWKAMHKLFNAGCSYCGWHKNENKRRQPTHGENAKRKHRDER